MGGVCVCKSLRPGAAPSAFLLPSWLTPRVKAQVWGKGQKVETGQQGDWNLLREDLDSYHLKTEEADALFATLAIP